MEQLTHIGSKSIDDFLQEQLQEHFPEWSVEVGENWELIATIFFNAGKSVGK